MKPLGKVIKLTKSGSILIQTTEIPSINSVVATKDSKIIGRVKDVFGPASKPYVQIKPGRKLGPKDIASMKNEMLYEVQKGRSKRRRTNRGKKGRVHRSMSRMS